MSVPLAFTLPMVPTAHCLSDKVVVTHYLILGGMGEYTADGHDTSDSAVETVFCRVICAGNPFDLVFSVSYRLECEAHSGGYDDFEFTIDWGLTPAAEFGEPISALELGLVSLLERDIDSMMHRPESARFPARGTPAWAAAEALADRLTEYAAEHDAERAIRSITYQCRWCDKLHGFRYPPDNGHSFKLCEACACAREAQRESPKGMSHKTRQRAQEPECVEEEEECAEEECADGDDGQE